MLKSVGRVWRGGKKTQVFEWSRGRFCDLDHRPGVNFAAGWRVGAGAAPVAIETGLQLSRRAGSGFAMGRIGLSAPSFQQLPPCRRVGGDSVCLSVFRAGGSRAPVLAGAASAVALDGQLGQALQGLAERRD